MAEAVAGLLASAFVHLAIGKLGSAIAGQTSLLWNFGGHLEEMKDDLETISAVLWDVERQSVKDKLVEIWLRRLKDAALEISDMLEDYQDTADRANTMMPGVLSCLPIAYKKIDIAKRMKSLTEKLRKITREIDDFSFIKGNGTTNVEPYDGRETTPYLPEEPVIARDQEKQEIIDLLSANSYNDEIVIVPIYGLVGIGKSTLAKLVYNARFKQYDHRVWVYVSQDFNLIKIGMSIICQLQPTLGGQQSVGTLWEIKQHLDKLLRGQTVLVVLDDLWEENKSELAKLRTVLQIKDSKVDVIVTTHKEEIARKFCTTEPYKLQTLEDDKCWDIIKRSSHFEFKSPQEKIGQIGLNIAKKCGGVALAAKEVGFMLRSKHDLYGWEEINNSDIWNGSDMLSSLKLSYGTMPPQLRICFSYSAIFPKGQNIIEEDLVQQWIALDFIDQWQNGKQCVNKLLGMSFLQVSNLPSVGTRSLSAMHIRENRRQFTMNDLVHDLGRFTLGDCLFVVDGRNMATSSLYVNSSRSGLFASVSNVNDKLENLSDILPCAPKILSLYFVGCSKIKISDGAFSSAKKLRLLDLRGCLDNDFLDNAYCPDSGTPPLTKQPLRRCSMGKLPESIGQLKHLRYLNAPAIQDRVLPLSIINGLSRCLRYLSLRCSRQLSDLTEAFGSMESLEHLDLSGCSGLKSLPKSFGACWQSLRHLDLSGCTGLKTLPKSVRTVRTGGSSSNLRHLDLSGCSCLEGITEALSSCTDLRYLNLSHRCGHSVEDWFHLKGLNDVLPTLKELRFLGISSCLDPICYAMPAEESCKYVDCIASLVNLEHLDLSHNKFLHHLPKNMGALRKLRTLDLSMCFKLESLQGIGEVNELRVLDISGCPQLNPLPEDTQRQLAKLPFLQSREWLTSIIVPSQASGSQEERSLIVGDNQAQDRASTSQDAARQPRLDPSSSESEITEIPENH